MNKIVTIFTLIVAVLSLTACSQNCCDNGPIYRGNMTKGGTGYSPQPNFNQPSCQPNSYELN